MGVPGRLPNTMWSQETAEQVTSTLSPGKVAELDDRDGKRVDPAAATTGKENVTF